MSQSPLTMFMVSMTLHPWLPKPHIPQPIVQHSIFIFLIPDLPYHFPTSTSWGHCLSYLLSTWHCFKGYFDFLFASHRKFCHYNLHLGWSEVECYFERSSSLCPLLERDWVCRGTYRANEMKYSLGTVSSGRRLSYHTISKDSKKI